MKQSLTVSARTVCGSWRIYPEDEAARLVAQIAGTPTLSPQTLRLAKRLGFLVIDKDHPDVLARLLEA